ncbi:MAG: hypothetical protein P4L85_14235 [Paludisphaera borealis]|uniref:hypothetical protein n=1 Tax=Paludisphaera borealis TaxID=1387353 RepID=UPI002841575C|nr:hypothetical protein [Paludisphaera borealis]MDR3620505.1 hypothetical protein [Paludisphaera borealis]
MTTTPLPMDRASVLDRMARAAFEADTGALKNFPAHLYTPLANAALDASGLLERIAGLEAELRHYQGRSAVPGKPLEIQSRDELLAAVRGMEALVQNADSIAKTNAAMARKLKQMETSLEAAKAHAIGQDCGRLCDTDPKLVYREQWKRSEAYVDGLIRQALSAPKPTLAAPVTLHDPATQN